MMNAPVGSSANVMGSSRATAIDEPRPGRTPTAVPKRHPTSTHSMFIGVSAEPNPSISERTESMSASSSEDESAGQIHCQGDSEDQIDGAREEQPEGEVEEVARRTHRAGDAPEQHGRREDPADRQE